MANRVLHIDFETFSSKSLKECGLENYVASKDFAVTVVAWAFDNEPVHYVIWPQTKTLPTDIVVHINNGGEIRAWNARFEAAVIRDHYKVDIAPAQVVCTMQKALAHGLPAGLLAAGQALGAPLLKDETRRSLMLRMSKPRGPSKRNYHEDPAEFLKLIELRDYCADDVRAERALDHLIPELDPFERKLSLLDGEINDAGVQIDTLMVARLIVASIREIQDIGIACSKLTGGAVTSPGTQTERLRAWLLARGVALPDMKKETVEEALTWTTGDEHQLLVLRQMAAKSSTAKLQKMNLVRSEKDDRARNLFQFYGAGRTGRWAGRLIQPQNLPRVPKGFDPDMVAKLATTPMGIRLFHASPMDAISKCLRGCLVAGPGQTLIGADFSQIEARVLAWLAGQEDVLDAFRKGEDVYILAARKVGSDNRDLGKVLTLACGFGMGALKFRETAAKAPYYINMSEGLAALHLYAWRNSNRMITGYWNVVESAVVASVRYPGRIIGLTHGMAVLTDNGVTRIRKPNGVKLTYHKMRLSNGGLVFDGVNGTSKKWGVERTYGGRLVENLVQSVARDIMAEAMLRVKHETGLTPVMTVHDEIIWEVPKGGSTGIVQWVDRIPVWALDLPIASETFTGDRYAK